MNLSKFILRIFGWKVNITVPDYPKAIICVAPHTSNLDFIVGRLAYASVGRKSGFLMKKSWFFFPLGLILKAMGGIPVDRSRSGNSVSVIAERLRKANRMVIAVTPEGTRSLTTRWRTGFLNIAREAHVPILLGVIDFKDKLVSVTTEFQPTGDNEADMRRVKDFYKGAVARHPEKFSAE